MIELIEYDDDAITLDNMGEKIYKLRKQKNLSYDALGKLAGISAGAVCKMEHGDHIPNSYILFSTLDALGQELILRDKR